MYRPILTEEFTKKQFLRNIIKEEVRKALLELSPEYYRTAAYKAGQLGRPAQGDKFLKAATAQERKALEKERDTKNELAQGVVNGKTITIYYDINKGSDIGEAKPFKYEISATQADKAVNGYNYIIFLTLSESNNIVPEKLIMAYNDTNDVYFPLDPVFKGGKDKPYTFRGFDMPGAQIFTKLAKAIAAAEGEVTNVTPNSLIKGETTPLAGKAFTPNE